MIKVALQNDGRILIGGTFSRVRGVPRDGFARLNPDGTLDHTLDPELGFYNFVLQTDGKILGNRGRLNPDGSRDLTFNPALPWYDIYSFAQQDDGRILIGQNHSPSMMRLYQDGSLDSSFSDPRFSAQVLDIALQADGKSVVGGWFAAANGTSRNYVARLNTDGTLDNTFNPGVQTGFRPVDGTGVSSVAVTSDGKIWAGGFFSLTDRPGRTSIARFNTDGTPDSSFNSATGTNLVLSFVVQPDGKVVLGTYIPFGSTGPYLTRLNSDGSLDHTFPPHIAPYSFVNSLVLQPDGKILAGGNFLAIEGNSRARAARFNTDGSLDIGFQPGVGSPALPLPLILQQPASKTSAIGETVTFEIVLSGAGPFRYQWFFGSTPLRGKTNSTLIVPNVDYTREGGYAVRVENEGGAIMSAYAALKLLYLAPIIIKDPLSQTVSLGDKVTFSAEFRGALPLTYTWTVNDRIASQVTLPKTNLFWSTQLVLLHVEQADLGQVTLTLSNEFGVAISQPANLTLPTPPRLSLQFERNRSILTWPDPAFTLQSAPTVSGSFTNIPAAASPYTNSTTARQQFFRLRAQ